MSNSPRVELKEIRRWMIQFKNSRKKKPSLTQVAKHFGYSRTGMKYHVVNERWQKFIRDGRTKD